ncbi:unnamed protein product [Cyprideis torosa]|uniref:Uncharacterized protein n=1 Tax=Cyprideis torosa TaxID=163714 RepID=A0A7R8WM29_9CRUS|nr:unnamed protein product [Cyprideis torosa]CAG0903170.1 unnamed protein product [Cyprideis torosa]
MVNAAFRALEKLSQQHSLAAHETGGPLILDMIQETVEVLPDRCLSLPSFSHPATNRLVKCSHASVLLSLLSSPTLRANQAISQQTYTSLFRSLLSMVTRALVCPSVMTQLGIIVKDLSKGEKRIPQHLRTTWKLLLSNEKLDNEGHETVFSELAKCPVPLGVSNALLSVALQKTKEVLDVNEGDAVGHDFSGVIGLLVLSLKTAAKVIEERNCGNQAQCMHLLKNWQGLYDAFMNSAAMVVNVDPNVAALELSGKLLSSFVTADSTLNNSQSASLSSIGPMMVLSHAIHCIVGRLNFSAINQKGTAVLWSSTDTVLPLVRRYLGSSFWELSEPSQPQLYNAYHPFLVKDMVTVCANLLRKVTVPSLTKELLSLFCPLLCKVIEVPTKGSPGQRTRAIPDEDLSLLLRSMETAICNSSSVKPQELNDVLLHFVAPLFKVILKREASDLFHRPQPPIGITVPPGSTQQPSSSLSLNIPPATPRDGISPPLTAPSAEDQLAVNQSDPLC